MRKHWPRDWVGIVLVCACVPALALAQAGPVWSDEFNGDSVDPANWEFMIGDGTAYGIPGWGNNELQYYTARPENAFVSEGLLHIVAREESFGGKSYTSARVRTLNLRDFLYGRLEARIKLPSTKGIWPAFWMLPTNSPYGGWAASGEIDIMESINIATTVHGTIHFGGPWPNNVNRGGQFSNGTNFGDDFHVYAIEWEPEVIRWYVDSALYHTETSNNWYSTADPENELAPFDTPFHLLLNVAVGGNWPGSPDGSSTFPQEMLVDWVRVYQVALPDVQIGSPAPGANLPPGEVTITATAAATAPGASIDRVEFFVNGVNVGADQTAPYEHTWTATDGCYGLMARAIDSTGQSADSSIVAVNVGSGCSTQPFFGFPLTLPGKVEAEDFDLGGEGVGYHDTTGGNNGGAYRPGEDVDLESCSEGGFNVGWMDAGEWLQYTIAVAEPGTYSVQARVASESTGGTFHIEFDGVNGTGNMNVPATGGWQNWVTIGSSLDLSPGIHTMRFVNSNDPDEYNINYFNVTLLYPFGDIDQDGDVDLTDYARYTACLSGPNQTTPPPGCTPVEFDRSDFDSDGDVDARDFAIGQTIMP